VKPVAASPVRVDVEDRQQAHPVDVDHLVKVLAQTLEAQHGESEAEVGLAFIDAAEMAELNITHMGGSGPTDVLAFPIDGVIGTGAVPDGQPAVLGDVIICPEIANQAPQPLVDELALLVVHGALHLMGHDHAEPAETNVMKALEVEMLDRFHRP